MGDLALEIETAYGQKRLQEFADQVGVSHSSMKVYRWVAGAYEKVTRVTNLSWSHHRAVASHPDRRQLLAEAGREGWSVDFMGLVADHQRTRENIDESLDKLLRLLRQAYEGKAWKALGYTSWEEYIKKEVIESSRMGFLRDDIAKIIETDRETDPCR